ncbi:MAG: hypothetical protein HOW97_27540 [Catenulispora sp.]|nr:hypothetical protein [Catenulispora sp.]
MKDEDETEFADSGGIQTARLISAVAEAEPVGPSPIDAVLAGGRRLRIRRRAALSVGMSALAAIPVAAVAVYGTTNSSRPAGPEAAVVSTAPTASAPTSSQWTVTPTGTPQVMPVDSGTTDGKSWKLMRYRYPVQNLLPGRDGKATVPVYCEAEILEFDGDPAPPRPEAFNNCNVADYVHMAKDATGLYLSGWVGDARAGAGFAVVGRPYGPDPARPLGTISFGDVDPAKVAAVSVTSDYYGNRPAQPVSRVGSEPVAYYAFLFPGKMPTTSDKSFTMVFHFFDANGREVGVLDQSWEPQKLKPKSEPGKTATSAAR